MRLLVAGGFAVGRFCLVRADLLVRLCGGWYNIVLVLVVVGFM